MEPQDRSSRFSRRQFLAVGSASAMGAPFAYAGASSPKPPKVGRTPSPIVRRHEVEPMQYRTLGATGMRVSEIIMGGIPLRSNELSTIRLAIERGVNYIDTSPNYARGESERAIGKLFKETPGLRDRLFLASKLSGFDGTRRKMYEGVFEKLSESKQQRVLARAQEIVEERGISKPGIFFQYFPNQERNLDWEYRILAMQEELGIRLEADGAFRKRMFEILDGSLQTTGAEYYDVLFCPHGASSPEFLAEPEMQATLAEMKQQGKARYTAVSTHTANADVTRAAVDLGAYDVVMATYHIANQGNMEPVIKHAALHGVGFIAMKVAAAVRTHHEQLRPLPA